MHPSHGAKGACWHCSHFGGWIRRAGGKPIYVWCLDGKVVKANPEAGCAFWKLQIPARTRPMFYSPAPP